MSQNVKLLQRRHQAMMVVDGANGGCCLHSVFTLFEVRIRIPSISPRAILSI